MKIKELKELKNKCMEMLVDWVLRGKRIGTYKCNHCKKSIPCRIPNKEDVASKGYWDSATICLECGECNFVTEYPNGKTKSVKIK